MEESMLLKLRKELSNHIQTEEEFAKSYDSKETTKSFEQMQNEVIDYVINNIDKFLIDKKDIVEPWFDFKECYMVNLGKIFEEFKNR